MGGVLPVDEGAITGYLLANAIALNPILARGPALDCCFLCKM